MGAKNVNMIRVNKGQQKKLKPAVVSIVHTSANSFRIIFILVKSRRLALWKKKKKTNKSPHSYSSFANCNMIISTPHLQTSKTQLPSYWETRRRGGALHGAADVHTVPPFILAAAGRGEQAVGKLRTPP